MKLTPQQREQGKKIALQTLKIAQIKEIRKAKADQEMRESKVDPAK
jgi:hypothetical protein